MPPSCAQLEADYWASREREWRASCWFARPAYADPVIWHKTVMEVARLLGEEPLAAKYCEVEPNVNPFGVAVRFS